MMKKLFTLLTLLFGSILALNAQDKDPIEWKITLKPLEANQFQLVAEASMAPGFHIWALDAGGDGTLINTSISMDGGKVNWQDSVWLTNKKVKTETYDFIDGPVHYFEKGVQFSRSFTTNLKPQKLQGTITFQACNEAMCFPPKDLAFSIEIQ